MSNNVQPVELPLVISIVGAGIGGLVAAYLLGHSGHRVTVFEAAPEPGDVGAGIALSPNATRLLIRWGLGDKLKEIATTPGFSIRRYRDGEQLSWQKRGETAEYGAPQYILHRADLFRILLDHARPFAIIRWNSKITSLDPAVPSVTLESGDVVESDLVIGADGLHSRVRDVVVGAPDSPTPTGDASYRALIPMSLMKDDPELMELANEGLTSWLGPGRHVVGYPIRKGELYNFVLLHPCKTPNAIAHPVDCAIMRNEFLDFEPRVQKLLSLVQSAKVWSLMDREPLESWVHKDGKVCLLGDACHPMLALGAVMTIEDAAVLGNLLGRITTRSQLPDLLRSYQQIRHARATATQTGSRLNQHIFHLSDGPEQEKRDASMQSRREAALKEAKGELDEGSEESRILRTAKERAAEVFSYDADIEVEKWLRANQETHAIQ